MLFFGTLCLGAMVYGLAQVMSGIVTPLYHPTLRKVGDVAQDAVKRASTEVYGFTEEDGFLQPEHPFRLDQIEALPKYIEAIDASYLVTFSLTPREYKELLNIITPLTYFESYAHHLSPRRQAEQRGYLITPILGYLDKIPAVRRSKT